MTVARIAGAATTVAFAVLTQTSSKPLVTAFSPSPSHKVSSTLRQVFIHQRNLSCSPALPPSPWALFAAGKGFGEKKASTKQISNKSSPPADEIAPTSSVSTTSSSPSPPPPAQNSGSKLLRELRSREAEKRDLELQKLRELRSVDATLQEDPGAAAIPEKVASRMGQRMLPFVGIPLFGSMGAFVAFWYLATYRDMEFQPAIVATTTFVFLAIGLLGITYSVMSASWDDDREGSGLGIDEFQKNVGSLKEGLSRSKENALLRERMAGLSEEEIQRAIDDQERRQAASKK